MGRKRRMLPAQKGKAFYTRQIIEYLRIHGQGTAAELLEETGIPIASMYRVLQALMGKNVVVMSDKEESCAGRKAGIYAMNGEFRYALGIYMAKRFVELFAVDMCGNIIGSRKELYSAESTQEQVLAMIDGSLKLLLREVFGEAGGSRQLSYIGITAEAALDSRSSRILAFSGLESMNGFPIKDYMEKQYGVRTLLFKAVNLSVGLYLDELRQAGIGSCIFLSLAAGIGAGIVLDGKLYEGAHGNAGELLYAFAKEEAEKADKIYTAHDLYEEMNAYLCQPEKKELLERLKAESGVGEEERLSRKSMRMLDLAVQQGEPALCRLADRALTEWERIARRFVAFYDPQMIILGGDISNRTPCLYERLKDRILSGSSVELQVKAADEIQTKQRAVATRLLDYVYEDVYAQLNLEG